MRDHRTTEYAWSYTRTWNNAVCGNSSTTYTGGQQSLSKGRSDIIQGNRVMPTYYLAYEKILTPLEFDWRDTWTQNVFCNGWYYPQYLSEKGTRSSLVSWIQLNSYNSPATPIVSSSVRNSARNRLLAKLAESPIDIGQFLGEAVQNAGELTRLALLLGRALLAIRRKQWKKLNKIIRGDSNDVVVTAANSHLAINYGLVPLVRDLDGAMRLTLDSLKSGGVLRKTATAVDDLGSKKIGSYLAKGTLLNGAQVGVIYKIANPDLARLNALGFVNPFALAWELMPLSFVFDWFASVGDFLRGLSAPLGLTYIGGYETTFIRTDVEMTDMYLASFGTRYQGQFPHWRLREKGMKREVLVSWPKSGIVIRGLLNSNQIASLLALIVQTQGKH